MYKITNKTTGESVTVDNLQFAEGMVRVFVKMNNDCGMKPRDSKKNYTIEKI